MAPEFLEQPCEDEVLLDLWHPLGAVETMPRNRTWRDRLLGVPLTLSRSPEGRLAVWRRQDGDPESAAWPAEGPPASTLPVIERYGYLWTSLGAPRPLFEIPEADESNRRVLHAISVTARTSAPRGIENFLDMGHFPFVHTSVLGDEPHTEVKDYNVEVSAADGEIIATDCVFYQPKAALSSQGGAEVDYVFRVPHPHCSVLYKSSPGAEGRFDVIGLFVQALDQEHIRAHMWLCLLDDDQPDWALRRFQVSIFGQDKPILENQLPRGLPLDPRAETPIRADKSGVAYRRWLGQLGVRYGVIPGAA
ncbi:aromatic ring-hydroxylating dioxygenase subunit alpha [Saccharopolyspora sp. NPDC050642]|uniref:aromatic ring-hydroxylating dioxygenase subunit alpha n=1 Tax=Saccharopolyspora sp. NPDC050642 TaxID=3157099 RepID=UPI0033D7B0D9